MEKTGKRKLIRIEGRLTRDPNVRRAVFSTVYITKCDDDPHLVGVSMDTVVFSSFKRPWKAFTDGTLVEGSVVELSGTVQTDEYRGETKTQFVVSAVLGGDTPMASDDEDVDIHALLNTPMPTPEQMAKIKERIRQYDEALAHARKGASL